MTDLTDQAIQQDYLEKLKALSRNLEEGDLNQFRSELNTLFKKRENELFSSVARLLKALQDGMEQFCSEQRLSELAETDIPDARIRLNHVLSMTDEAAHETMDRIDQALPIVDQMAAQAEALLPGVKQLKIEMEETGEATDILNTMQEYLKYSYTSSKSVQQNLHDILMAQGYQDISGQILRQVVTVTEELEQALSNLMSLYAGGQIQADTKRAVSKDATASMEKGSGPVVPNCKNVSGSEVDDQSSVDDLLASLGC